MIFVDLIELEMMMNARNIAFEEEEEERLYQEALRRYSLTQNFGNIDRIDKMSSSKPSDNGKLQLLNVLIE